MVVFGYARISVDIEQDRDNTSIENQKRIIEEYVAREFPAAELKIFVDRDRSGYTFEERTGYQELRKALLSAPTKILIIKDFSRFSRRNSKGLMELETLCEQGVRFISIGDGIDYPTKDEWMLIQFKFLMNEMPVTETSKKIKAIIANRQKNGKWICAVPYGYRWVNTKEMTYEVDPAAAVIVRQVFELYNNGWGYKKIANYLTDKGIPTPRANEIAWKEANGQKTKLSAKSDWSIVTISGMLSNDFYIGTLRQKKYTRKGINGADRKVDETEQYVHENAHDPIVDLKTFQFTQEELKRRSTSSYRGEKKYATDYSGYLFCGNCGSPMFSMSRPELQPAYVCGTYHRRGKKGCTSHHIRVDKLDELLKRYVEKVRDNSKDMIGELEKAIRQEPEREQEIGVTIEMLQKQLRETKDQLKAMFKRKLLDTMGKTPEETEIIDEAYAELEQDLTKRVKGLEAQIEDSVDSRNRMVRANRAAKTVLGVFDDILQKPKLDKQDIGLIVENITIFEDPQDGINRIDIQLKADIDALLKTGQWESSVNFNQGIENSLKTQLIQRATHQKDKVFDVNVISSGDPLEIYTEKDGGVIFRKYSPMGDLQEQAGQICDSMGRSSGRICAVCDRDGIIAVSGAPKRELLEKRNTPQLEEIMEQRKLYRYAGGEVRLRPCEGNEKWHIGVAAPILTEGDVMGCVLLLQEESADPMGDTEQKLAQTVAEFLGKQMES